MAKKPRKTKEEREREEEAAGCTAFAEALTKVAGFDVHIEPVHGYAFRQGGFISLGTMLEIVARLQAKGTAK